VLENYKQEEKQHIKFKQYQVTSSIYGQIRGKHMDREIS
jgi:dTDP-4-dehydrorhamnose 3,5-epimerase-like enzyme